MDRSNPPGLVRVVDSGEGVGLLGLAVEHEVPCNDCGSRWWADWTLLPHAVFNAVCPGGNGYLCLPCFARRLLDKENRMIAHPRPSLGGHFRSWLSKKAKPMTGAEMIAAERQRQVESEGWTPEHDDEHQGDLVRAAEAYMLGGSFAARIAWPWDDDSFRPTTRVRDLTKAGALIAAEIDRLQRRG